MEFYSMKLRKKIDIPKNNIEEVTKVVKGKKRTFMVGSYKVDGKVYKAWRIK